MAGSDSVGGAGIQADLKTFFALGVYGTSVLAALTAQNTVGVQGVHDVPPDFVAAQIDAVLSDIGTDAAKTGMLSRPEVIEVVAARFRHYGVKRLVVDPVMVAKSGHRLLSPEAEGVLARELLPLAMVVTPNLMEAAVLADRPVENLDDMKEAARAIHALGAAHVVVKGGHLEGDAVDLFYDGKDFFTLAAGRVHTANTHGTGCTFSAAIAAGLARGEGVYGAVTRAKEYVTRAINHSFNLGRGHGPTNHWAGSDASWSMAWEK